MRYLRPMFIVCCVLGLTFANAATGLSSQENRRVRVINRASVSIYSLYASNVDRETWEEDVLGQSVIPPGGSRIVNIDDGTGHCMYDLKAVMSDGRQAIRRNLNVCTASSWTVTDR